MRLDVVNRTKRVSKRYMYDVASALHVCYDPNSYPSSGGPT